MNERMPSRLHGRDVRLNRLFLNGREVQHITIKGCWILMQEKIGDGKWWSLGRGMTPANLKKLHAGIHNRAWYAGYDKEMLEVRVYIRDGLCFRWAWQAQDHPDIESNRRTRLANHAKRAQRRRKQQSP